ncbi:MAG: BTAD domain-containing putative transcriptional regulator [Pseudomonadota bacterium]
MTEDPAAPALELRLLGAALAREPGGPALTGLGAKGFALLAYLALQPGQAAPRDSLVELLWSRGTAEQGRASLRQELRRMKRALGPRFERVIETPAGQLALRPGAVVTDHARAMAACEAREAAGLAALPELYGGAFLAPLSVNEIPFEDWTAARNSEIEARATEALLRLMLLDESAGRLQRAAAAARALLTIDPLQEDVHAALVRLHVAAGRLAQARRQVERAREIFLEELGEPPETDLEALIPAAREAARAAAAPAPRPARDPAGPDPRPLLAVLPCPETGEAGALARTVAESALEPLRRMSWMRVADGAALLAAGAPSLAEAADYAVTLRLSPGKGAVAEIAGAAPRGEAGAAALRRLEWPERSELAPAAGLARLVSGALASELLEAETRAAAALPEAQAAADPWRRLMRARAHLVHGGPRAAEALRAALEPDARGEGASEPLLCLLALSHLEEAACGWSAGPREAAFRGRELALRALRRAPGDPWPQHVMGLAASLMEDPASARAHQLRALELAPGFAPAIGEMARLLALTGDASEAEGWAARALETAPGAAEAALWLRAPALARFAAGDWAGALEAADRALAARPDWAQTRLLRAACLRALAREAEADETLAPAARPLARMSPDALRLSHPFAAPGPLERLLAELPEAG